MGKCSIHIIENSKIFNCSFYSSIYKEQPIIGSVVVRGPEQEGVDYL